MPRSRINRAFSPLKNVSSEKSVEEERRKIFENVKEALVDCDNQVIGLVLDECNWNGDEAVDRLLLINESKEEQKKYKSKLQHIAEGIFGTLKSQNYASAALNQPTDYNSSSPLSQSQKVIQRPTKTGSADQSVGVGSSPNLLPAGTRGNVPIEDDAHFPRLPSKPSERRNTPSPHSQKSHSEQVKQPAANKGALLSNAQNAFQQQYDDAEGAQRWEECKLKFSKQYLNAYSNKSDNKSHEDSSPDLEKPPVFGDDPAILQAGVSRPRPSSGRSFPVRLLSNSPDDDDDDSSEGGRQSGLLVQNLAKKRDALSGRSERLRRLNSADLDETVMKCIYQVHGDLLDEDELSIKQTLRDESTESAEISTARQPMTLPTVGLLSAEAAEFVPRPRPVTPASAIESVVTSPVTVVSQKSQNQPVSGPASKVSKSVAIEIKPVIKNVKGTSPTVLIGSPMTVSTHCHMTSPMAISPSLSPGLSPGLSPPNHLNQASSLAGSPMFITPKYQGLFQTIGRPPPMFQQSQGYLARPPPNPPRLASAGPPAGYRFPVGNPQMGAQVQFAPRMMFSVAPPTRYHMSGVPAQYVHAKPGHLSDNLDERAAIATGQPIMATSEKTRMNSVAGKSSGKLLGQDALEKKVEHVRKLQDSGLKLLIIVRGLPGSGKTTLARALKLQSGSVFSTDDYFMKGQQYEYKPEQLTDAHQWNRDRAKEAMKLGQSPVVIDNTNTQKWEFKPYVNIANNFKYHIELMEPDTPWKFKPKECAKRTVHGVPLDHIQRMLDRYEQNIKIDRVASKKKGETRIREEIVLVPGSEDGTEADTADQVPTLEESTEPQRSTRDLLGRLYRADDLKMIKQRSESDSDSISTETMSLHSEPWSNTSSRNASPKPLRPTLKTPGALLKLEKSKQLKPTIRTTVKKVQKKAIKKIEEKLSPETVLVVNELINEHAVDKVLSVDDVNKLEEELKALLSITLANDSEMTLAEELIGLKLHDLINKSFEEADEVGVEESDATYVEVSDSIPSEANVVKQAAVSNTADIISNEFAGQTESSSEQAVTVNNAMSQSESRPLASWKDIAVNSTGQKYDTPEVFIENDFSAAYDDVTGDNCDLLINTDLSYEREYWGQVVTSSNMEIADSALSGENIGQWESTEVKEDTSDWKSDEHLVENQEGAGEAMALSDNIDVKVSKNKPQRKKKRHSSSNSSSGSPLSPETGSPKSLGSLNNQSCSNSNGIGSIDLSHSETDSRALETHNEQLVANKVLSTANPSMSTASLNSDDIQNDSINQNVNSDMMTVSSDIKADNEHEHSGQTKSSIEKTFDTQHSGKINVSSSLQLLKDSYVESSNTEDQAMTEIDSSVNQHVVTSDVDTNSNNSCDTNDRNVGKSDNVAVKLKDDEAESNKENIEKLREKYLDKTKGSPSSPKVKKPSKRRIAAKVPFLDALDKEKFISTNWNSFPILSESKSPLTINTGSGKLTQSIIDKQTDTERELFNILDDVNSGRFVDSSIQYLTGNARKVIPVKETNGYFGNGPVSEEVANVHMVHKSTSTTDLSPISDQEGVEFLQTSFPEFTAEELECVLETCDRHVEWAINLLLDWNYSLKFSDEEKKRFTDGMAKVQRCVSPDLVSAVSLEAPESAPPSLQDLCFNFVEDKHIATREELENQMIQTGKHRLESIEDDFVTRIRLNRSTSLTESSAFDTTTSTDANLSLLRSLSSPSQINDSYVGHEKENVKRKELASGSKSDFSMFKYEYSEMERNDVEVEQLEEDEPDTSENIVEVLADDVDASRGKPIELKLDLTAIKQLEEAFGKIDGRNAECGDVSVWLDHGMALRIYEGVKHRLATQSIIQTKQQLLRDEEYAKQLHQEETDRQTTTRGRLRRVDLPSTRPHRPTPLVGVSVQGTVPKRMWANRTGNHSLVEIMKEEEQKQEEQQNFNLSETINSVKTTTGETYSPKASGPADWEGEQQLIEATKQQSMQELLDSYIYHPPLPRGRDFQDGQEPEYEDFRGEANLHYRLRHECFQKAREAHSRGLKQVASFYSQQRNMTLDLHGLHIDESIAALERILPQKEKDCDYDVDCESDDHERCRQLVIITGRGSHSRGGVARLRPAVIQYLKQHRYKGTSWCFESVAEKQVLDFHDNHWYPWKPYKSHDVRIFMMKTWNNVCLRIVLIICNNKKANKNVVVFLKNVLTVVSFAYDLYGLM
ncbi:N42L2-like protein [Mya arenaria]|uniref:N42L2-like protein n=1 Tax=Mya arenaria TaxID=6604 RepID=A0ABY7DU90_MYAAR|nr:N42L2-like protein [Mya arenaria]